jgi:hypothetical protein
MLASLALWRPAFGQFDPDAADPFADLETSDAPPVVPPDAPPPEPWWTRNTLFRKELYSQFVVSDVERTTEAGRHDTYSRQSVGFEVQRRFESATSTVASCDFQGRLVRRDRYLPVINDMEGEDRSGWYPEYHNAYCDLFNPLSHLLPDRAGSALVGAVNFRIGRFYLPLGLNIQTDTHGPVLQLSNDQNLGYERDWYAGFWGGLGRYVKYDLYYMTGSGYDLSYSGQSGLLGLRVASSALFQNETGVEAGLAVLGGQRLAMQESPRMGDDAGPQSVTDTVRYGPDLRYTLPTTAGSFILTNEINGGLDSGRQVLMELHQAGYLHNSRRYGANVQYRRRWQERARPEDSDVVGSSIFYDLSYYLANDLGNSNLHWINVNVEQKLEATDAERGVLVSLQYYRYW